MFQPKVKYNTVKPGLYECELYEILDFTYFLSGPGEIPFPYIKSLSCTNLSYTKSGLYDRFSRSKPKIYLVYTNFSYGLRGKIAHFFVFFSALLHQKCRFFFYFVNLRFYVNCIRFYRIVQGHNSVKRANVAARARSRTAGM